MCNDFKGRLFKVSGTIDGQPVTQAIMADGTFKREVPKSYKKIGLIRLEGTGLYNSPMATIYKRTDGTLMYCRYIDGCFYELYGKIKFL